MASPTSRTLATLRKMGARAQVVEKFIVRVKQRVDLFGFIDIVAMSEHIVEGSFGIIGIQACAASSHANRRTKIITTPEAVTWLKLGGKIQLWSWGKKGRGKRKVWTPRIETIKLSDIWRESEVKRPRVVRSRGAPS